MTDKARRYLTYAVVDTIIQLKALGEQTSFEGERMKTFDDIEFYKTILLDILL
jgi:hypothetical protein